MDIEKLLEIAENFTRLMNLFVEMNKTPRYYGTEVLIYPAEVHYLEIIGKYSDLNVTELAGRMGVTKGAVSQILIKLERKGLIERYRKPGDEKAVYLELSRIGVIAFEEHAMIEKSFISELYNRLKDSSDESAEEFKKYLIIVEEVMRSR